MIALADLAAAVADLRMPDGWAFAYEYPGFFEFTHARAFVSATPDWEVRDAIPVLITSPEAHAQGDDYLLTVDHPWPQATRSGASYLAAVAPYLAIALHLVDAAQIVAPPDRADPSDAEINAMIGDAFAYAGPDEDPPCPQCTAITRLCHLQDETCRHCDRCGWCGRCPTVAPSKEAP